MDQRHHVQKIDDQYLSPSGTMSQSQHSTPVLHQSHEYIKAEPSEVNFVSPQHSYPYKQVPSGSASSQFNPQHLHSVDPSQGSMFQTDYASQQGQLQHYRQVQQQQGQYYHPQMINIHPQQMQQIQQLQEQQIQQVQTQQSQVLQPDHQSHLSQPLYSEAPGIIQGTSAAAQLSRRKRPRKGDHSLAGDDGETELKQLALKAATVPLQQLAMRIKQLENEDYPVEASSSGNLSPNLAESQKLKEHKERQRQIFGMVWLYNSCESSPTAVVPRNRIYARYVQVCADNSLTPLSPASFGKLVRISFPNLATRRLGMRGQSKYHYCGIKLIGDQNLSQTQHTPSGLGISSLSGHQVQSPISSSNSSVSLDDSPATSSHIHTPSYTPINSPSIANSNSISDQLPSVSHLKFVPNLNDLLNSNLGPGSNPNVPLNLPSIYPYLQRDIDYDIADTLYSLYKVHVNSLFESLRYMQLKKLFSSFNNFNSTLTAPVFKLYTHDSMIEWVKQCDLVMYKRMIRMLNKLQLQFSIPPDVLIQLKQVSSGYVKTLSNNLFNNKVTKNFIIMKLKLAKNFVNFLNRLIKVIETGQSASRILTDPVEKKAMVDDWLQLDVHEIISREIPCGEKNIEVLLHILNSDLLNMLTGSFKTSDDSTEEEVNNEMMIQISAYISELPGKFTNINPRLFILLTSNLLTTCLREISLTSGQGFGAWWIVRCWIDEFLSWRFELGGLFQEEFGLKSEPKNVQEDTHQEHSNPIDLEAADASANTTLNISGTNFINTQISESDVTDSNLGNVSTGAVDLLGFSYGLGHNATSSGSSANPAAGEDILLNYEGNDNYH